MVIEAKVEGVPSLLKVRKTAIVSITSEKIYLHVRTKLEKFKLEMEKSEPKFTLLRTSTSPRGAFGLRRHKGLKDIIRRNVSGDFILSVDDDINISDVNNTDYVWIANVRYLRRYEDEEVLEYLHKYYSVEWEDDQRILLDCLPVEPERVIIIMPKNKNQQKTVWRLKSELEGFNLIERWRLKRGIITAYEDGNGKRRRKRWIRERRRTIVNMNFPEGKFEEVAAQENLKIYKIKPHEFGFLTRGLTQGLKYQNEITLGNHKLFFRCDLPKWKECAVEKWKYTYYRGGEYGVLMFKFRGILRLKHEEHKNISLPLKEGYYLAAHYEPQDGSFD